MTISSTRSEIGCAMTSWTPGRIFSFSHDLVGDVVLGPAAAAIRSRGMSETIGSASFGPAGSAGDSPRPRRDTAIFTPGTSSTRRIASFSILMDSSSEMFGTRSIAARSNPPSSPG